ncbi:MAG: primosomal protein [bacterium]
MAKLLSEFISFNDLELIKEDIEMDGIKKKEYYLKGPFLQAEIKNRNGRQYQKETLIREVNDFNETKIKTHRSLGELDHPPEPTVNLDRVSHIITSLEMKEDTGFGLAKLIDTPCGKIAKTLVDEGVLLGMSTRGVGSLDGNIVKDDFKLITVDIVADPSAPNAFVEGILENRNFIIGECGDIVEVAVNNLKKKVDKKYNSKDFSYFTMKYLREFLDDIDKKLI